MEEFLRAAGFDDVFNDDSAIRPDEEFWPAIEKGIADCDSLVVIVTAASYGTILPSLATGRNAGEFGVV